MPVALMTWRAILTLYHQHWDLNMREKYLSLLLNVLILYIFITELILILKRFTFYFCLKKFAVFSYLTWYYSTPKKTSNNWQLELQKTNTCSVAQLCLTLCDTMPIWVSISLSRRSSWPWDQTYISCVSCISSWILYHCTWEALSEDQILSYLLILLLLSTVHKMKLKLCTLQMGNS